MTLTLLLLLNSFFFFKQKTAYEMRISDWSSDVCSSDLRMWQRAWLYAGHVDQIPNPGSWFLTRNTGSPILVVRDLEGQVRARSEEHTSELQSLMRISYAVFCLTKKKTTSHTKATPINQNL